MLDTTNIRQYKISFLSRLLVLKTTLPKLDEIISVSFTSHASGLCNSTKIENRNETTENILRTLH